MAKASAKGVTKESKSSQAIFHKASLSEELSAGKSLPDTSHLNVRDSLANMPSGTTFAAKARAAELNAARARRAAAVAKEKALESDIDSDGDDFSPLVPSRPGMMKFPKPSRVELPHVKKSEDSKQKPQPSIKQTPPPTRSGFLLLQGPNPELSPSESSVSSSNTFVPLANLESSSTVHRPSSIPLIQANNHLTILLPQPVSTSQVFHPNLQHWNAEMPPRYSEVYSPEGEVSGAHESSHLPTHSGHGKVATQARTTHTSSSTTPTYSTPSRLNNSGGMENKSPFRHLNANNLVLPSMLSVTDDPFRDNLPSGREGHLSYGPNSEQFAAVANSTTTVKGTTPYGPIHTELRPELYHESAHRRHSGVQPLPPPGQSLKEIQDAHFRDMAEKHGQKISNRIPRKREWEMAGLISSISKDSKLQVLEDAQAEVNASKSTRTVLHDPLANRANGHSTGDFQARSSISDPYLMQERVRSTEPFPLNYPEYDDAFLAGQATVNGDLNECFGVMDIRNDNYRFAELRQLQNGTARKSQSDIQNEMYQLHTEENLSARRMHQKLLRETALHEQKQASIQHDSDPLPTENGRSLGQAPIGSERRPLTSLKPKVPASSTQTAHLSNKDFLDVFAPVLANLKDSKYNPPSHLAPWGKSPAYAVDQSLTGDRSFFEASWGNPPARVARDARYRTTMHEGRPTYFEDIGRGKGQGWGRR